MYSDDALIAFCQKALQTPSFSGREEAMAKLLREKMLALGFDEVVFDRLGNVIGTIHGKRPGKTILLDGHMDTVDVIDKEQWAHDPFGGEIEDGRIYGRGASDMKGSDCAMVMAAGRFAARTKKDFAGTVCVSGSVHEECFEGVAPREITKRVHPDFVIVGEATSTSVKIGQRGRAEVVVETEGVSCHSSNSEKGVNAVYEMLARRNAGRAIRFRPSAISRPGRWTSTPSSSQRQGGGCWRPGSTRRCRTFRFARTAATSAARPAFRPSAMDLLSRALHMCATSTLKLPS